MDAAALLKGMSTAQSARLMHKLAIIRSMSHGNANHVQAALAAQTGHAHPLSLEALGDFPPASTDFPPIGAVLDAVRPTPVNLHRRGAGRSARGQMGRW